MNKLTKHIFVVLFISCFSYAAFAQNPRMQAEERMQGQRMNRQEFRQENKYRSMPNPVAVRRVQVIKEHFLSTQLALTPEQSEKFWPLYRHYQVELSQVRQLKHYNNSNAQVNGAEQVRKDLEYDGQLVDIRKRYNEEFLKIMPPEKVSQLYKSERGFTDELIKNLNERNNAPQQ